MTQTIGKRMYENVSFISKCFAHGKYRRYYCISNLQSKSLPTQTVCLIPAKSAANNAPRHDFAFPPRRNSRFDSSPAALRFHGKQKHCNVCNATMERRLPVSEQTDDP